MRTNFPKIFPTSSGILGKISILSFFIITFSLFFILSINHIGQAKSYNIIAQDDSRGDGGGRGGDRGGRGEGTGSESAAEPIGGQTSLFDPLGVDSIPDFIIKVMDAIQPMILLLAVFFIILSGFQFLKAQGDPTKIKTAQTNIKWTLVGVAIVVGARALIALIIDILKEL